MKKRVLNIFLVSIIIIVAHASTLLWMQWKLFGSNFLINYNYIIWAAICAAVFIFWFWRNWTCFKDRAIVSVLFDIIIILVTAYLFLTASWWMVYQDEDVWTLIGFVFIFVFIPSVIFSCSVCLVLRLIVFATRWAGSRNGSKGKIG